MRTCGCGPKGRHRKECTSNDVQGTSSLQQLYVEAYGKPPNIIWERNKKRQATVERRIKSLVRRLKPFYLTVADYDELWYIDGGNWVHKINKKTEYNLLIGHIKNILPFFHGSQRIPWGDWNKPEDERLKKKKRRRK